MGDENPPAGVKTIATEERPSDSGPHPIVHRDLVDPEVLERCLQALLWQTSEELALSPQQSRILWLNLWGYADQEIATCLRIALHTVQDYQHALRKKTGVRSKAGYLRLLLEATGAKAPF